MLNDSYNILPGISINHVKKEKFVVHLKNTSELMSELQALIEEEIDIKNGIKIIFSNLNDNDNLLKKLIKEEKDKVIYRLNIENSELQNKV